MAIFPYLGPEFYDEKDRPILQRMEAFYAQAITINQSFWGEADTDTRFECGDQTLWSDLYGNLPANRRRQFNFNRIRRVVNMISGHQRRNRMSLTVVPVENGDQLTADEFTQIMLWLNQQEGIDETISQAFHGALVTGMNLLHLWMDYRQDPVSGNIKMDVKNYNAFLIDPYFKKTDLSDCNGIWTRTYVSKKEALSLLPDNADFIASVSGYQTRDGKFQFLPESYNYGQENLLTYDEFYYKDFRTQQLLIDTKTGETTEWRGKDNQDLRDFLQAFPEVTTIKQEIPTVKLAIVVQGKVLYDGPQPSGIDVYPFVPVLGYYNPQIPYFPYRVQGVVRGLRDAQYLYNRRKVIELDILESQINSGFIYKEDALVNPKDVYLTGQGRGLALKQEAQITDVQQIQPPQIPPSMIELSKILADEIQQISGVNDELLGSAIDDKAGVLAMLRQGAGLTTLQTLFDQLNQSHRLMGRIIISMIQNNFTPGKVQRIIAREPSPQFYDKTFGKYDAAIEEGYNTTTQKQMQFAQMLHLRSVGVPIPDDMLLQSATLQNKQELIQAVAQQQQAIAQAQQQKAEADTALVVSQTKLANARAVADQGLGLERMSRIQENEALAQERKAEAVKDENAAALDMIKAMKEIESIDIANLEKILALTRLMRERKEEESTNSIDSVQSGSVTV